MGRVRSEMIMINLKLRSLDFDQETSAQLKGFMRCTMMGFAF